MVEMTRLSHGLWRRPQDVVDLAGRCAAVLDAMPPGTVAAGRTAAALHGLWLPTPHDDRIELIISRRGELPRALAGSRRREFRARRRTLRRDEIAIARGLPVTTEARTWVDLGEELALPDVIACGDSVLRGSTDRWSLEQAVRDAARRRGVRQARAALPLLDAQSRSRAESHLRCALVLAGLPVLEVNARIVDEHGSWLAEPDLVYRRARLALEYNGADHAEVRRMRRDLTRGVDLVSHGWLVISFGPAEVFGRPWTIPALVRELLERRAPGYLREWCDTRRVARNIAPLAG
jgi:hypothetical protein